MLELQRGHVKTPFALPLPACKRGVAVGSTQGVSNHEERTVDGGPIVVSQIDNARFDDKPAKLDEMPRPLAACNLPV